MNNRRRNFRICCRVAANIEDYPTVSQNRLCYTSNISMKGLFMVNIPHCPLGSSCQLLIHDRIEPFSKTPLSLVAKVSHLAQSGVGFTFEAHRDQRQRLENLVNPKWDGDDYLEGVMLMMRHSEQASSLKDGLSLTSLFSSPRCTFKKN